MDVYVSFHHGLELAERRSKKHFVIIKFVVSWKVIQLRQKMEEQKKFRRLKGGKQEQTSSHKRARFFPSFLPSSRSCSSFLS